MKHSSLHMQVGWMIKEGRVGVLCSTSLKKEEELEASHVALGPPWK